MKKLHNRVNKRILKLELHSVPSRDRITFSFYKYHQVQNPAALRDELYTQWNKINALGRVYVAHEGINAQMSVPANQWLNFKESLSAIGFLKDVRLNMAVDDNGKSFFVLKIQVKKKLVSDGLHDETFDVTASGKHVNASEFNALADLPETIIVDMRNHYESEVGHFSKAICPDVDTFKESLPVVEKLLEDKKDQNIIMYCTGGIRCEKASAWMKHRGFKNVFQLDGGIIEYARQVKSQVLENKFKGKNFVFDERMGERISEEVISVCHQCGKACDTHTNCRNDGCHLLFIQCAECAAQYDGCCSKECQEIISLPVQAQKELRRGKAQGRMVFKKGRSKSIKFKTLATSNFKL